LLCGIPSAAQIQPERWTVESLPEKPGPHWVWVDDMNFNGPIDGRTYLVDTGTGDFLGMLGTGYLFGSLILPSDYSEIYAVETYFSRGARGTRTDVLTIYDPQTLTPTGEIEIPPKKASGMPMLAYGGITDDDRFALVYNFTPAQSVSVIDVKNRKLAGEIDTAGCALVYPSGARRFQMLCGNGGMLTVTLDDEGKLESKERSDPFFDPNLDPVTEKAVRWGDRWLFVSADGYVHPVDVSGKTPRFEKKWSLVGEAERKESWKIGGSQHLAVHQASDTLYSLMHQGGPDTHKDGGNHIWVYDLKKRKRTRVIETANYTSSLQVTQDENPLLITAFIVSRALDVYDARSGEHLRTVEELALNPTFLQVP
jgi:methylamine dehydrogenase heavy chain